MGKQQLILSIGGNLGDKADNFSRVIPLLSEAIGEIVTLSPIYESSAWGFVSEHLFWNRVVVMNTLLSPEETLEEIGKIERSFGRIRSDSAYRSRAMDIDILFYADQVILTPNLTIPHPRMAMRKFVLLPLADVLPDFIHPVTGESVLSMLESCQDTGEPRIIG